MKNLLIILIAALALTGCGKMDQLEAHYTGFSKICIDGVTYIQFTSGASVQVDRDGKPVACK
jgi:uncharacterized protein YceK